MHAEHLTQPLSSRSMVVGFEPAVSTQKQEYSSLHRERNWRELPCCGEVDIVASRWCDNRTTNRQESTAGLNERYTVAVALRPTRMTLRDAGGTVFEGSMPIGTVHVAEPGQALDVAFSSPCDFIHFHVAETVFDGHLGVPEAEEHRGLRNLLIRDELTAQLSRTLADGAGPRYAASVGQTVLMRVLAHRQAPPRIAPLPKWRLRRVHEHLAANIAEPVTLADLAAAAGLSRMHFAAQFRAATGCRPHDYLLQHRIEYAKHVLATTHTPLVEVALSVGFQTQSHFSTVFKRLTGDTPGRWQRAQRMGGEL